MAEREARSFSKATEMAASRFEGDTLTEASAKSGVAAHERIRTNVIVFCLIFMGLLLGVTAIDVKNALAVFAHRAIGIATPATSTTPSAVAY